MYIVVVYISRLPEAPLGGAWVKVAGKKALIDASLEIGSEAFKKLDTNQCGVLIGSGMGGIGVLENGVKTLVEQGPKKISPFMVPFCLTSMGGALFAIETGK